MDTRQRERLNEFEEQRLLTAAGPAGPAVRSKVQDAVEEILTDRFASVRTVIRDYTERAENCRITFRERNPSPEPYAPVREPELLNIAQAYDQFVLRLRRAVGDTR